MTAHPQPSIWTLEIDGKPMLAFEAKKYREAYELCHEDWLRAELGLQKLHGVPLCGADSHLKIRLARRAEMVLYRQAAEANNSPNQTKMVYLIELDDVSPQCHGPVHLRNRFLSPTAGHYERSETPPNTSWHYRPRPGNRMNGKRIVALLMAEDRGPLMHARIGMLRALISERIRTAASRGSLSSTFPNCRRPR